MNGTHTKKNTILPGRYPLILFTWTKREIFHKVILCGATGVYALHHPTLPNYVRCQPRFHISLQAKLQDTSDKICWSFRKAS